MKHRTQEQWATLVSNWSTSGKSAKAFCEAQGVGYFSFCQWRKRLAETQGTDQDDKKRAPAFIDLSSLGAQPESKGWHIVLRLGDGMELCLRQGD